MDIVRTSMCRASRNALRAFFALAVLCVSFSTALSAVSQVIRSTEYSITLGQFTGTTYNLTLNQTLASDYFIIVRGGIDTSIDSAATPDYEYARVSAVPSGKGDLPDSGASNQITLARYASDQNWVGIVTVVECLAGTAGPGFKLITIDEITMANGVDTGTSTAPATWPSGQLAQIVPIGGYRGGGAAFTEDVPFDATGPAMGQSILTKLTRSGTSTIGWKRDAGGSTLKAAVMTVFVIQWGFEWTVQSVNVAGTNAGDGVDATGEYTTAAITSVVRADTWVWGCGFTTTSTAGNNAEACVVTLGDGVNENATETAVAVGCDEAASYDFQVYTMTQSRIAVDHAKLADGNSTALTVGVTMGQSATTSTERMSVAYNTCDGTSTTRQTRCRFRSNFTANDTITLTRGYQGTEFAAWVQSIDFSPLRTLLITGSNPAINKIDHTGTNVSVTFTDPNPANYTTGWYTTSSMTGRKSYGISLSFGNTIQRQGLTPNFDGECVETTLTTTISKSGHPLGNPRVWRWWRATGASSGDWTGDNINIGGATTYTHDSDVGDVDGDGDLDIAVAYANATINVVWLNDGTGAFPSSIDIGTEAEETRRIKFLDFDRDGDLDIFVANNGVNRMYTYAAGAYTLQFTSAQSDASFGLAVGDMNADSYPDVVVTNNNTAFTTNQLYINNYGTLGTYTCTMRNLGNTNVKSRDCDIGDVDNDGDLDIGITVFSALGGQNFIYLMDSSGWVESTVNVGPTLVNSRTIDFGDFNGDRYLDCFIGNGSAQDILYMNDGDGTFDTTSTNIGGAATDTWEGVINDVDGDNDMDIVVSTDGQSTVYFNDGAGTVFSASTNFGTGSEDGRSAISLGDFDGDGRMDCFKGNLGAAGEQDVLYYAVPQISGNIYTGDDTGLSATTATIRAYNCTQSEVMGTRVITGLSAFTIGAGLEPADGDMIMVYTDTATTADLAAHIFFWNSGTSNQANIHLRKGYIRFNENDKAAQDFNQTLYGFANMDNATNVLGKYFDDTDADPVTATKFYMDPDTDLSFQLYDDPGTQSNIIWNNSCDVKIYGSVVIDANCIMAGTTLGNIYVGGDWTGAGTTSWVPTTTSVWLNGTTQSVTSGGSTFWAIYVISGSTTTFLDDTTSTAGFQVQASSTIELAAGVDLTAGVAPTAGIFSIQGTLEMDANESVKFTNGGEMWVENGGTLRIRGTSGASAATAGTVRGVNGVASDQSWKVIVHDGGTVDVRGGRFVDGWVTMNDGTPAPVLISFVRTYFYALSDNSGSAFIELDNVATGRIVLSNLYFTRLSEAGSGTNCTSAALARNISADAESGEVHVTGYSGPLGGEAFDDDPEGRVHWVNGITPFKMDLDGAPTTPASLDEALDSLGTGTTLKLWAHYEDTSGGANVLKSAFGTHVGTLTIPATLGVGDVLELDGFTFVAQNGNDTVINNLGLGTVKLYNCMIVDPWSASGTNPDFVDGDNVQAYNCTIDTNDATDGPGGSGFTAVVDCIEARDYAGTPQYFLDYDPAADTAAELNTSKRDFRLTKAGHDAIANISAGSGSLVAGHERDIDGKERPDNTADQGCCYYGSDDSAAMYQTIDDITDGSAATPDAVLSPYMSIVNGPAGCYYATSYDGTNCYLSLINWSDQTIAKKISWSGYRCANPTFVQCDDASDKYWVYVAYAKDQPDKVDTIRRILHNSMGNDGDPNDDSLSASADTGDASGNLASYDGSNADITGSSGWEGQIFLINSFFSGTTEMMVALTTQQNGGEVHTFFININSGDGEFYKEADFDPIDEGKAAESYKSNGGVNIKPNPYAPLIASGSIAGGTLVISRVSEGGGSAPANSTLMNITRSAGQHNIDDPGVLLNTNNDQSTSGTSFSAVPGVLTNTNGDLMSAYNGDDRVFQYALDTLTGTWLTDVGLTGYGAPDGVNLCQDAVARVTWVPLYNSTTGNGAVAAIEYAKTGGAGDNDSALELLTNTYADTAMRYHDSAMTHGSFYQGVAHIVGKPVAVVRNITDKGVWCATDAGYLYGWRGSGTYGDATADKGALKTGFPKQFGAPIAYLDFMRCTDNTINAALGFGAGLTKFYLAVKNERGEVTLVRRTA